MPETDASPDALLDRVTWPVHTERLTLRRADLSDAAAVWAYRRLADVGRWTSWHPADRADWDENFATRHGNHLIIAREDRVIGDIMVRIEDGWAQREVSTQATLVQAELGWTLHPDWSGQGYAAEALRETIQLCFTDLGLRRVTANMFAANAPSRRLAERLGMRLELHTVSESLHRDLGWVDGLGYALLAEEWRAAQGSDAAPLQPSPHTRE